MVLLFPSPENLILYHNCLLFQAVARKMVAGGYGGAIVNVSSYTSKVALEEHAVYNSSKAALDMLTKVMALELGPHKVSGLICTAAQSCGRAGREGKGDGSAGIC